MFRLYSYINNTVWLSTCPMVGNITFNSISIMKSCFSCFLMITIASILISGGFIFYQYKGCGNSVDTLVEVTNLDYSTGTKWIVRGNNLDYVIANDPIFSMMKPQELASKLSIGKTYKLRTCGWDIPLIKFNKIIVNAEQI